MQASVAHILALTTIRRERLLPVPGRVVARLEQKVSPVDVIAEANFGQEHALVDVARTLGISTEAAHKMIQCKIGNRVTEGQVLAQKTGLVSQAVRAPCAGRVIIIGGGRILLEVGEGAYELRAGMPGTVTRIITDRGAEITVQGALVQGVWGNGRVDAGLMLSLLSAPDEMLERGKIDVSMRGSILLGGICEDPAVLQAAGELPVRGLILGSMAPGLIPLALQARYPVLVMDGFGRRPMNSAAYKLLTTSARRETTLNTAGFDRHTGVRPEAIIPLPVSQDPPPPRATEVFAPGQTVCLRRLPHIGEIGTLSGLRPGATAFPSGLRVPAGEVRLESGEQVVVPLANLEVIG
jgi:hypothetical protein